MPKLLRILIFMILIALGSGLWPADARASAFVFSQEGSVINGIINYTLVGKYHAVFDRFEGEIRFDEQAGRIRSVALRIHADTIRSNHPNLDKIVKSGKILDVNRFPDIIFESTDISPDGPGYRATGDLTLHGVTKTISFPFDYNTLDPQNPSGQLQASGRWVIPRKEYGIIWNKILDKGGIIVGNHITVDWHILAGKI